MTGQPSLLERIGNGDQQAVALCVERYSGLVWSLARRFIAIEADAEDAVQEIFVEIWNTAGRFDPSKSAEATYISMIARRRLIDRLRKTSREPDRENLDDVEYALSGNGPSPRRPACRSVP
ncbi:MAG: sigma-70 family RNA polymerase sigma factor [Gammaproteobacteria bacterium]